MSNPRKPTHGGYFGELDAIPASGDAKKVDTRPHDTNSLDCWCGPKFMEPCEDCDDGAGCWKCERGLIAVDYARAALAEVTVVVVHNE